MFLFLYPGYFLLVHNLVKLESCRIYYLCLDSLKFFWILDQTYRVEEISFYFCLSGDLTVTVFEILSPGFAWLFCWHFSSFFLYIKATSQFWDKIKLITLYPFFSLVVLGIWNQVFTLTKCTIYHLSQSSGPDLFPKVLNCFWTFIVISNLLLLSLFIFISS
jgi:hypothetical protein